MPAATTNQPVAEGEVKMFFTITAIAIALASLSVHELGHAFAMRQCGVGVKSISLLGIPGLGTIKLSIRSRMFPGTEWFVHPFIIGAYVEPNENDMERLSTRDALYVYGMGPLASIAFLFATLLMLAIGFCALQVLALAVGMTPNQKWLDGSVAVLGLSCALGLIWYFRRAICQYALLPIGCVSAALVIHSIAAKGGFTIAGLSDVVGEIHSARQGRVDTSGGLLLELVQAVILGGILSAVLGLVNLVPLVPLDGGHMMRVVLPKRWQDAYAYLTLPVFAVLMILQFGKDIYNVLRFLFW